MKLCPRSVKGIREDIWEQVKSINQVKTLYLLQHGGVEGFEKRCFIGQIDPDLSDEGCSLALTWKRRLRNIYFNQIWCSDLKRALKTARIVAGSRKIPIYQAMELREICMGVWDGMSMLQVRENFPELWEERGKNFARFRPPNAETFHELQYRVVPFIKKISLQSKGNILIVTHPGVIRVVMCHLFNAPLSNLFRLHLDYGGLTIIKEINGSLQVGKINQKANF